MKPILAWPTAYDRLAEEVVRRNVAVVASVNHTGTWFLLRFLEAHPRSTDRFEIFDALARNAFNERSILHFHVAGEPPLWDLFDAVLPTGRVLVPVRDPLAAMITRHARHPFLDHRYIATGFARLAANPGSATFLPIDLPERVFDRAAGLSTVLRSVRWDADPNLVASRAGSWGKENSIGYDTAEKAWYRAGDFSNLRRTIGREIEALLDLRSEIRPFLEDLGYKDLSWWAL